MKTTREQILDILKTRHAATPAELARALHLTPANIRHHLKRLVRDGRVRVGGRRRRPGRGRPENLYTLARRGDNLAGLSAALLEALLEGAVSPEEKSARLQAIALRLIGAADSPAGHITQRLYRAVQQLEKWDYQPRWEAHAQGPRIILGNCPYAAIIAGHPELCQMDAHLLEAMIGRSTTQTAKLELTRQGLPVCVFVVRDREGG